MHRTKPSHSTKEASGTSSSTAPNTLDLRGTYCPMAFVKARIFLDAQTNSAVVDILYEDTPANDSLARSIKSLGHTIVESSTYSNDVPKNTDVPLTAQHSCIDTLQLIAITVQVKK
ncbi:sulfurtransferase TusA family protein [Kordiimonas pumila]|uniref:Sulfurtransferase TusA family protein n=1 Tax=Kordiimonas pumila TaxID=2161677 RepID=A0ABV7CZK0_9PROT|nr:sulfurtransferase TusA family protein [Kordiimonas pumila]